MYISIHVRIYVHIKVYVILDYRCSYSCRIKSDYKSYTGSQYLTMVAAVHLHPMSETQERKEDFLWYNKRTLMV